MDTELVLFDIVPGDNQKGRHPQYETYNVAI